MSSNKMKDHLVSLNYLNGTDVGTGVILASHDRSDYYYIFTAKHNFPYHSINPDVISSENLEIRFQASQIITAKDLKVYFPNEQYDLALVVFKSEPSSLLKNVKSLKIYNSDLQTDRKKVFTVIGYPHRSSEDDFDQNYDLIYAQVTDYYDDNCSEILKDERASTTHAIKLGTEYYAGMSGGGVFFEDQYKDLQLRSIIKQYSGDSFSCIRLDQLIDELNTIIEQYVKEYPAADLDRIETGDVLFAGDEAIEIDEIINFNFFKSSIDERIASSRLWSDYELNEYQHKNYNIDKDSLKKIALVLRKQRDRIKKESDDLSYFFSYIAIASHNNQDYRLSTNYFLEATRLNPKHTQTLLLEKHERKDQIKQIEAASLVDLKRKYELLLKQEKSDNPTARRQLLLDAIKVARTFEDDDKLSVIKGFEGLLVESYENDNSLRDHHKYKELGDYFYSTSHQNEKPPINALKFHTLSLKIAKISPQTDKTMQFVQEFEETYHQLYDVVFLNECPETINESTLLAIDLVRAEEDPETKRILLRVSDEISDLKAISTGQERNVHAQARTLTSMSYDLDRQTHQNYLNALKIDDTNKNIIEVANQAKSVADSIKSVDTRRISSQLLRIEDSALKVAKDLSSKLLNEKSDDSGREKKPHLNWPRYLFTLALKSSVILILLSEKSM